MKIAKVAIEDDPEHPEGGHALVRFEGLRGLARKSSLIVEAIDENAGGKWIAPTPLILRNLATGIVIAIGPDIVEHVPAGIAVRLIIPEAAIQGEAIWPSLAPLRMSRPRVSLRPTEQRSVASRGTERPDLSDRVVESADSDPHALEHRSVAGAWSIESLMAARARADVAPVSRRKAVPDLPATSPIAEPAAMAPAPAPAPAPPANVTRRPVRARRWQSAVYVTATLMVAGVALWRYKAGLLPNYAQRPAPYVPAGEDSGTVAGALLPKIIRLDVSPDSPAFEIVTIAPDHVSISVKTFEPAAPSSVPVDEGRGTGFGFWAENNHDYFYAVLYDNGSYAVAHLSAGRTVMIVPRSQPRRSLSLVGNRRLQLALEDGSVTFAVDGVPVTSFTGVHRGEKVGVFATGGSKPEKRIFYDFSLVERQRPSVRPARRPEPAAHVVEFSVFSPETCAPAEEALVQVFLHRPRMAAAAARLAQESDSGATRRGIATLETEVEPGQTVEIRLEAPGLLVDAPIQRLTWRGDPRSCQFLVNVPPTTKAANYRITARIFLHSVPVGKLHFTLRVTATGDSPSRDIALRGDAAHRYQQAFLSYASADRLEVLKAAQYLKAVGIGLFQDIASLRPGANWFRELYAEIDKRDLFLLFWSSAASKSEWVLREAEYASQRALTSNKPEITPLHPRRASGSASAEVPPAHPFQRSHAVRDCGRAASSRLARLSQLAGQ